MNAPYSIELVDPNFKGYTSYNPFQRFILRFIRDERDLPFIYLCLKIMFLVIPVAAYLFIPGCFNWWIAIIYLGINMGVFLGPFILMLHNTCHRKLFKKEYDYLNLIIPWLLGPFYGESPETYFHYHITMHHIENNVPPDVSSTMPYRRDNLGAFLRYFGRFFVYGIIDVSLYFNKRQKAEYVTKTLLGEICFILMCIALCFFNWKATFMVFIMPFLIARFAMMAGNWAQHAFIDAKDPGNSFRNSITCINSSYNKKCFNDGYHIGHHLRSGLHWTEMPGDFIENLPQYVSERSVVFEGIDYFYIWFLLMTKNYNKLASKFVDIGKQYPDKESIIAFLKTRVEKIG